MLMKRGWLLPAAIIVVLVGASVWLIEHLNISIEVEPTSPTQLPPVPVEPDTLDPSLEPIGRSPLPTPLASSTPAQPLVQPSATPSATPTAGQQGALRVSNQTDYPLRVALLPQRSTSAATTDDNPYYGEPVHWDFAPQEGSARGLLLALPNRDLKLNEGDVLVVFAQDGSRRYWGLYVVGKTTAPIWSQGSDEWQLIVQ